MRSTVTPLDYRVAARSGDAVTLLEVLGGLALPSWAYPLRRGGRHCLAVTWDHHGSYGEWLVVIAQPESLGRDLAGHFARAAAVDLRGVGLTTYWPQAAVERVPL